MRSTSISKYSNRLVLYRRRKSFSRKQVARLLGHRSIDQISRLERGMNLPNLKTALKLAIIYQIPVSTMLDGYFAACLAEVRRQETSMTKLEVAARSAQDVPLEVCTYEERLSSEFASKLDIEKAGRHSIDLIRKRAEKLNHL